MTPRTLAAATLWWLAAAAANGDAPDRSRGEALYDRCIACHAIERNRTGPLHCGLFGRKAGAAPGFAFYSEALRASGIVWNARTLGQFLRGPAAMVPGTTMGYAGVTDAGERAELIAWLQDATRAGARCTVPGVAGP